MVVALVLAGGAGRRMGASRNKVFLELEGQPLLAWSLEAFQRAPSVDRIVLVLAAADFDLWAKVQENHSWSKLVAVVPGGAERAASAAQGLRALTGDESIVLIHDGARPLVTPALIEETVRLAKRYGSAVPGLPVKETIKEAGPVLAEGEAVAAGNGASRGEGAARGGVAAGVLAAAGGEAEAAGEAAGVLAATGGEAEAAGEGTAEGDIAAAGNVVAKPRTLYQVARTPVRAHLWTVQTPQGFRREVIVAAYAAAGYVDGEDLARLGGASGSGRGAAAGLGEVASLGTSPGAANSPGAGPGIGAGATADKRAAAIARRFALALSSQQPDNRVSGGQPGNQVPEGLLGAGLPDFSFTDDASLVEALGLPVYLFPGDEENIKITTPLDLELAKILFRRRRA